VDQSGRKPAKAALLPRATGQLTEWKSVYQYTNSTNVPFAADAEKQAIDITLSLTFW
jgi:hypothetical protein